MDRMEKIAANVNPNLAIHTLISLNDGYRSTIGDWIFEGDEWLIERGIKVKVGECFFNYGASRYTRAPQTIITKSVEIPKPISVLPESGVTTDVFSSDTTADSLYDVFVHTGGTDYLHTLLKRGRLHLTAEAAIAHSKADIEAVGGTWE